MNTHTSNDEPEFYPHCSECNMTLWDAGEYHPYAFCVLRKAGLDPWQQIRVIAGQLGLDDPGEKPPITSRLVGRPLKAASQ